MVDDLALIPDRLVAAYLGIGLRALRDREKRIQICQPTASTVANTDARATSEPTKNAPG
jgi:hypothetical protein